MKAGNYEEAEFAKPVDAEESFSLALIRGDIFAERLREAGVQRKALEVDSKREAQTHGHFLGKDICS